MEQTVSDTPATNSNPPLPGYRSLSQAEYDLIVDIKKSAENIRDLQFRVERFCIDRSEGQKGDADYVQHTVVTEPMRWAGIARTNLQQGFMALNRAVAAPTSF